MTIKTVLKPVIDFVNDGEAPINFQEIRAKCCFCGGENRFPIPQDYMSYGSLAEELEEHLKYIYKTYYQEKRETEKMAGEILAFTKKSFEYSENKERLINMLEEIKRI